MPSEQKKAKSRKPLLIIGICAAVVIIAAAVVVLFVLPKKTPSIPVLSSNVKSVMNTSVKVIAAQSGDDLTAEFCYPLGIALTADGGSLEMIVADSLADRIQIINMSETDSQSESGNNESGSNVRRIGIAGSGGVSYAESGELVDGALTQARFKKPSDIAVYGGEIIVCDTENNAIRRVTGETVRTVAGAAGEGYQNGKASGAKFNQPRGVAADGGDIYVADTMNHCIRKIDKEGNVTLFAGNPEKAGYADGKLTEAMFFEPSGLVFANGALYIADTANHSIRKIENGEVTTVAGRPGDIDPATEYPTGGLADGGNTEEALFNFPTALTVLPEGDIYVADTMNHCIRLITEGETRTVIGGGESGRYYESVENLKLSKPSGIASDGETLYISDALNNSVIAVPITKKFNRGRPLRSAMLDKTGVAKPSSDSDNEPRVFVNGEEISMKKVKPWSTAEYIYIPVKPLFEALGAEVDKNKDNIVITMDGDDTELTDGGSYFIHKGEAVMPDSELVRLFPFTFEWFPEVGVIAIEGK